jgi:hypothetical protein
MYSSKNVPGVYLVKYFEKWHFRRILSQKVLETAHFFAVLVHFGQHGDVLTPLTLSTTTLCTGNSPTNSRRTKQFLSRPHSL